MIDDKLIELMKNNKVIANHLHLPLQSGCERILKLMNRKYTPDMFFNRVLDIRKARPDISITADVIAGFPGEEDIDHEATKEFIKKVGFSELHVFPYSLRKGTAAAKMPQTNDTIKKNRALELIKLSDELKLEYSKKFIDNIQSVIIEKKTNDKYMEGHTSNYLKVLVPYDEAYLKKMVDVKIISVDSEKIIGKIEKI